jgi:predicted RND superfamily exporter protein
VLSGLKRILGVDVGALFGRAAAFSLRNAAAVVAAAAALGLAGLVLALGLSPSAAPAKLSSGDAKDATARLHRSFGDEPAVIVVKGHLTRMLLMEDVQRLLGLEGCISGNQPASATALDPVCREFAARKPVDIAYGPGTFINDAAGRILDRVGLSQAFVQRATERAARQAIRTAKAQGLDQRAQQGAADQARSFAAAELIQRVQVRTGFDTVPALNNPRFVLQLVFAPTIGAEEPKPRFAYVFPSKEEALIQARLRSDLTASERSHAIDMLREAVASPVFKLRFGSYVVTGDPVLREGVASGLAHQAAILLVAAGLLVALALALAFRGRFPLLPLVLAFLVAAVTFGLARLAGASLTLSLVALLPVLLALAGVLAALLQDRSGPPEASRLAAAGAVIAAGLVALCISPLPIMRSFGALAALAVVLIFAAALTAGVAAPSMLARLPAGRLVIRRPRRPDRWGRAVFGASVRHPGRTLWIALGVAVAGWALGTQVPAVSDLRQLGPSDLQEVKDATLLRNAASTEGQVSVLVHGKDLADPRAIAWMAEYQGRILVRHRYTERRPCRNADLCPALSLTNIFGSLPRTEQEALTALRTLPAYFSRSVITPDRRTANIGFVLSKMSADRRKAVIDDMRAQLHPPPGVTAEVAGQPVLDAQTRSGLGSGRWTAGLAALVLVFGVLFGMYRTARRAIVPLVPAALATGWTALAIWVLGVPLNPVSVGIGAILVAIGSGLATLLHSRYLGARASGKAAAEALDAVWRTARTDVTVPALVLASGFLALTVSDFRAFRDFGIVALTGLALELAGLMLVLPATLLVAEQGISVRVPRSPGEAAALLRDAGRRARVGLAGAGRAAAAGVRRAAPSRK